MWLLDLARKGVHRGNNARGGIDRARNTQQISCHSCVEALKTRSMPNVKRIRRAISVSYL